MPDPVYLKKLFNANRQKREKKWREEKNGRKIFVYKYYFCAYFIVQYIRSVFVNRFLYGILLWFSSPPRKMCVFSRVLKTKCALKHARRGGDNLKVNGWKCLYAGACDNVQYTYVRSKYKCDIKNNSRQRYFSPKEIVKLNVLFIVRNSRADPRLWR